jgi:hypothetical protein
MANDGWTQTPPAELIKGTPEWFAERDRQLTEWEAAKRKLEEAKADEMEIRKKVVAFNFNREKLEGTERVELNNGWELKAVKKLNYNFVSPVEGIDRKVAVDDALTRIEQLTPEGSFIADRLVKWTPELSVSEYRKLEPQVKAIIDTVIETKEGAPTLELVPPKGTK